jgi:hypothetical protein
LTAAELPAENSRQETPLGASSRPTPPAIINVQRIATATGVGSRTVKAFLVTVNGQRVCLAGIGKNGSMAVAVEWVGGKGLDSRSLKEKLTLIVGGLDSASHEHAHWTTPKIRTGDKIQIEIIETDNVDDASERFEPLRNPNRG